MTINVTCEFCGKKIKAKDSAAGKKGKCPECGSPVQIPDLQGDDIYDAEPTEENAFDFNDYDPNEGETIPTVKRKPCPACGEEIAQSAAKCRFCGEIFDPALKKKAEKEKRKSGSADIDEDMTTGDWVVAVLCSGIGCIAGIIWMIQGKPKGGKMVMVSFGFAILWNIVRFILAEMARQ